MIREYSFPNIFQNILGDIIPDHLLCRMNQPFSPRLGTQSNISDKQSIAFSSESDNESFKNNFFGIKSKQKKIQRRSQMAKTNFEFATQSPKTNKYTVPSRENEKHVNFLKKNSNKLTSNASQTSRSKECESLASQQSEINIQVSLADICSEIRTPPSKRNVYRIRTSIDEPILLDRIAEEEDDLLQTKKKNNYRQSKLSRVPYIPHQTKQSTNRIPQSKGKQSKKSIKNSEPPSEPRIRLQTKRRVLNQGLALTKKKTVNFSQRASISNNNTRKPFNSRNQSSASKYSSKRRKSPGLSRFKFSHPSQSESSEPKSESQWTAKSVISIKFYDDDGKETVKKTQKQKSIRSKDSILQSHSSMKVRPFMKRTKTVKFIRHNESIKLERPYRSEHTISVKPKYNSKYKQNKFLLKRKKTGKSQVSNGSQVKISVKGKKGKGRGSILKKLEPIGFTFSSVRNLNIPVQTYSFQEIVIKRSCMGLRKTMLKVQKKSINVYDELNTFLQFISEEDQLETQREIEPTLNKPIIIPEEIHHREINNNQELFNNENQMIDLGLKLVKKMNKLTQKKY